MYCPHTGKTFKYHLLEQTEYTQVFRARACDVVVDDTTSDEDEEEKTEYSIVTDQFDYSTMEDKLKKVHIAEEYLIKEDTGFLKCYECEQLLSSPDNNNRYDVVRECDIVYCTCGAKYRFIDGKKIE